MTNKSPNLKDGSASLSRSAVCILRVSDLRIHVFLLSPEAVHGLLLPALFTRTCFV